MGLKKICSKCRKAIIDFDATQCDKCQSETYKAYDLTKRDQTSKAFYCSKAWRQLRQQLFNQYGNMDLWYFAKTGRYKKANTLHHIIELSEDYARRLDPDNLIPVSQESHSEIHKLYQQDKQATQKQLQAILSAYRNIFK